MSRFSDRLLDRTSGVFVCNLVVFPTRNLFYESEPTTGETYFDLAPEPRTGGLGPGVVYECEARESPAGNRLRPAVGGV
jgi:hypothetical protein